MVGNTPQKAKRKPTASTRVGNGKVLLAGADGRSIIMRRMREILAALHSDMGGDPSEAKMIIARRATSIAAWCETQEARLANNEPIDIAEFTTATNALRRLLADIGLDRKAKDITPDLDKYLQENYGEAAE